jgi:hypothetical protein
MIRYEGNCHRVFLKQREKYDPLVVIQGEDDGHWFEITEFDIGWLPEFMIILQQLVESKEAQAVLKDIKKRHANGTYFKE